MSLEAQYYICVAFVFGVGCGYLLKKRMKLSSAELEDQLSRLDGPALVRVNARLQASWQISDEVLLGQRPDETSGEEKKP